MVSGRIKGKSNIKRETSIAMARGMAKAILKAGDKHKKDLPFFRGLTQAAFLPKLTEAVKTIKPTTGKIVWDTNKVTTAMIYAVRDPKPKKKSKDRFYLRFNVPLLWRALDKLVVTVNRTQHIYIRQEMRARGLAAR